MNTPYHDRGHLRALIKPAWVHLRRCACDPSYRGLHRFARQLRGVPRRRPGVVKFEGKPVAYVDAASFLSAWDEIFVNGIYDIEPVSREPLLVDVGANIGLAALRWRTRYSHFRYLGFEPDPGVAACCRANLAAWDVAGEVREAAVGPSAPTACFQRDGADGGRLVPGGSTAAFRVPVERLSVHLAGPVDLLKIDVEGAEFEVLREIASHLDPVRRIFVEWHHAESDAASLGQGIALLEEAGFSVFVQVAAGPRRPFLPSRTEGPFLQQLNLSAVRR